MSICLFNGLWKDGVIAVLQNKSLLWGQRQLWTLLHCFLIISYLQPPTLSADAAGWEGLAWPAPCTADLRKAGGRGIISGQVPPEICAADLGAPLLRSMSAPGSSVLSVFCSWRPNVFLWEERHWAGLLARTSWGSGTHMSPTCTGTGRDCTPISPSDQLCVTPGWV